MSGNRSDGATALFVGGFGNAQLEHVTIAGPEVFLGTTPGPTIELIGTTATFTNSAVAGPCSLFFSGSVPESLGGNVVEDTSCLVSNSDDRVAEDLEILPLASIGSDRVIHLPRISSPLVDAATGCLAVDQRDVPRGEPCDAGSAERVEDDNFVFLNGFES